MKILDLSAGNRAIWFNKNHPMATYLDIRKKVKPTHMNCGRKSNMSRVYGHHTTKQILETIEKTGKQVHRVSKRNALMALKWNNHDIKLERVFHLLTQWEPLFGHLTKDGPGSQTYWIMLRKLK